jgi:hypothetical protein
VIHWNAQESEALVELVRAGGHQVGPVISKGGTILKQLRAQPPQAVVIDLTRQASHGREVAIAMRGAKTLKHLPILFVDGEAEKVEGIRRLVPDAVFTTRSRLLGALKRAKPVANPVRPPQMMERFGNRTAAQKLGITTGMRVAVIDPPTGFERVIGELPDGSALEEWTGGAPLRLTLWFAHDPDSFLMRLRRLRTLAAHSRLWILWRKKKADGLDGGFIMAAAMEVGLVQYKICSVDATWSGMVFAVKKVAAEKRS